MDDKIKSLTGFDSDILMVVWEKYCGYNTPISKVDLLVDCYEYIHTYPTHRRSVLNHFNNTYISNYILPSLRYLSEVIDEVNWEDRLDFDNHSFYFDKYVTSMVDTMPIFINKSIGSDVARATYNGRYKENLYKVQVVVDFKGRIVFFSGPHIGSKYDGHIFAETEKWHPRENWEIILGDGHYSSLFNFLTPFKRPKNGKFIILNLAYI